MTGDSFVNSDRPGIHCGGEPEVAKPFRRFRYVTNAILIQSRGRRKVVVLSKLKRVQIFGRWSKRVMLDPLRHGENAVLLEKFADLKFFCSRIFDPRINVRRHL